MMKCNDVQPMLDSLLDNELPTQTAAELVAHMRDCMDCAKDWEERQALRERMHSFGKSITVAPDLVDRIERKVQARTVRPRYFAMAAAAAAVVLVLSWNGFEQRKPEPAQLTVANMASMLSPLTASAPDANDLAVLSKTAGFDVCPLDLPGFKLASAKLVSTADKSVCMARLIYSDDKNQQLTCYEGCHSNVQVANLDKHYIDGKLFCCGKIGDTSVVYFPRDTRDFFMFGALPTKDILGLAVKS